MNWIHCNKCSSVPATGKCFFWLTSCGHVFCGECAGIEKGSFVHGTASSVSCFVCHHNVKAVQIRRGMDQSAAVLFRPPNELLQKLSQFYKIGEIIKFQAWQFASFQRLRQGKDTSQEVYYKQLLQKKDRELEKALEENKRFTTLLENKEKEIRQLSQQQKEMTQNNLTIMDAFSDDSFMPPPTKRQKYLSMNCHSFNTPLSFGGEFNKTSTPIQNHSQSSSNSFVPASSTFSHRLSATGSIFHRPSPLPLGKITKGQVLPPQQFKHRWCK